MGNNAGAIFCCKGRKGGLDSLFNDDAEGNAQSYFEYTADQSEVDMERGAALASSLKHNTDSNAK